MIRKRLTAVLMSVAMIFSYSVNSMADEVTDITEEVAIEETSEEEILEEETSEEETDFGYIGGYIDTGERVAPYKDTNSGLLRAENYPEKYDSRDYGYITPPRNQGIYGVCWTFAPLCAGEASLIKQGLYTKDNIDLSEYQLLYYVHNKVDDPMGLISDDYITLSADSGYPNIGGYDDLAYFSLMTWRGAVYESEVPYEWIQQSKTLDDSYAYLNDKVHLQNVYIANIQDKDIVKQLIMDYGAVTSSVAMQDENEYFNRLDSSTSTWAFYQDYTDVPNHAITIIGWDDDFSVDKFNSLHRPSNPGAWLIKNSWGTTKSYMWVSYDDSCLSASDATAYIFEKADNYDYNYQYDGGMVNNGFAISNGYGFANIYDVYGDNAQSLDAVAIYLNEDNIRYELQIYKNPSQDKPLSTGTPMFDTPQTGYTKYTGYNTIKLDNPVTLYPGERFSVVFKFYDDYGDDHMVSVGLDSNWTYAKRTFNSHAESGQSFYVYKNGGGYDLYDYGEKYSYCARIKAYTNIDTSAPAQVDISECTYSSIGDETYTGSAINPEPIISYEGSNLVKDTDYTLSYENNINAGTAIIHVRGISAFKGTKDISFNIKKAQINSVDVGSYTTNYTYTGSSIKPDFVLTYNGKTLVADTDYTYSYSNNTDVSTNSQKGTISIVGKGNFTGTKTLEFNINQADISDTVGVYDEKYTYTGKAIEADFSLTFNNVELTKGVDYTCTYKNNTDVGVASIEITGIGNFTGAKIIYFNIVADNSNNNNNNNSSNNNNNNNAAVETVNMYRLYNPNSGEHFYTASSSEKDTLVKVGWRYEGIGWKAPKTSNTPVYRLYNKNAGDHHYTMSVSERDFLVKIGWKYEGIGWYSDDSQAVPLYRQYNPNAKAGSHNYTVNKGENDMLVGLGWKGEGIGWYGVK